MSDEELSLHQIRPAFLKEVERRHAEHGFTTDYRSLAQRLGITVVSGSTNQAITTAERRLIVVDERIEQRARFSGLHELAHHFFEEAQEGYLRALLKDIHHGSPEVAQAYEEELCDAAAAILLMPNGVLQQVVGELGFSPLTALLLVERCGASVQAATRRVLWHCDKPSFSVLMRGDGKVLDSVSHGHPRAYPIGRNFYIEMAHPLRTAGFQLAKVEPFKAPVPFSGGGRSWTMYMQACDDGRGRTLAFFSRSAHITHVNGDQPGLF